MLNSLKAAGMLSAIFLHASLLLSCSGSYNADTENISSLLSDIASDSDSSYIDTYEMIPPDTDVSFTDEYVISCLASAENIVSAEKLNTDTSDFPDGCTAVIRIVSKYPTEGTHSCDTFTTAARRGGCVEIYDSEESAIQRFDYLSGEEGKSVNPCLFRRLDNLVIRTSEYLTVYNAIILESEIVSALDSSAAAPVIFIPEVSDTGITDTTESVCETEAVVLETTAEVPETSASIQSVWIPRSGTKYHSKPSCSNMSNPTEIPLEKAISDGYTPCKRCH